MSPKWISSVPANKIRSRTSMTQLPSVNAVYQSREDYVFLKISEFLFVVLISDEGSQSC
jgi:hypothetical protein